MKNAVREWRMLIAEWLLSAAVTIAPPEHPDSYILAKHLKDYADDLLKRRGRGKQ